MKIFFYLLLFIGTALLLYNLFKIDYGDPLWYTYSSNYLGIIGPVLIITAMVLSLTSLGKNKPGS